MGLEDVTGSPHKDVLRGTEESNDIFGSGGDDLLEGRGGNDELDGGVAVDTATYEGAPGPVTVDLAKELLQDTDSAGNDDLDSIESLTGSPADDDLRGNDGVNRIDGGGGRDTIAALEGDDTVFARDGVADAVDCGAGTDLATLDAAALEAPVIGCELALFEPAAAGPAAPAGDAGPAAGDTAIALVLGGARSQRIGRRGIAVSGRCPREACSLAASATLKLGRGTLRFRGARTSVASSAANTLRLRLRGKDLARVLRALRRGRRLTARVSVTATDAAANRTTRIRAVRLRA